MPTVRNRGLSRIELVAATVVCVVLGSVAVVLADPGERQSKLNEALNNLRQIDRANAEYREDNTGRFPFELTSLTRRGFGNPLGWCTWSYGGKNPSVFWYGNSGGLFDVEAADRPLNAYVYPNYTFYAPPAPARLPANDPARATIQAKLYRDPADTTTHQRTWPGGTNGVSCYDDVGSSFQNVMSWWGSQNLPSEFRAKFAEGCRRLAVGQGIDPARFVTYGDEFVDIIVENSPAFRITNPHGDVNHGVSLFYDGHTAYMPFTAGAHNTATYQTTFTN